jgi:hypothetical protein
MNESPRYGQDSNQSPRQDPYGGSKPPDPSPKPPQKDPCDEPNPTPPGKPEPPVTPDCPPPEPKCPEKKPCPELPPQPPDPCDPKPADGGTTDGGSTTGAGNQGPSGPGQSPPRQGPTGGTPDQSGTTTPTQSGSGGGAASGTDSGPSGSNGPVNGSTPADPVAAQIAALKKDLEDRQKKILALEPLKASVGDITQRIQALEKMVDGQAAAATGYKDFFRSIEVAKSEIDCFIPTVRCQLELTDKQKQCICDAIKAVDTRVNTARGASDAANQQVAAAEKAYKRAADKLAWIKQWYDFLKSGIQAQVGKQRDDLKTLKGLADPSKNQCEVWFYLLELERLTKSDYGAAGACWRADINVATFIECWRWDCYGQAWNIAVVTYNDADADEKLKKSELEQAKKNAADLDKLAKEAETRRREWILNEIKSKDCCGPLSKCPDPKPQGPAQGQGRAV